MARKARAVQARAPRNSPAAEADEILRRTADILVAMGYSPRDLVARFALLCRPLKEPTRPFDQALLRYVSDLPHILAHWYADADYVDDRGQPLWLALQGKKHSLAKLIQRVLPGSDLHEVVRALILTQTVRRRGRLYRPIRRFMSLTESLSFAHAHSLTSMRGLLRTVQHNISEVEPARRLLERSASNPAIPLRLLGAVQRRLKRDVTALLASEDSYLRELEVTAGSEPCTSVHLVAYAHEDPQVTGTSDAAPRTAAARPPARRTRRVRVRR